MAGLNIDIGNIVELNSGWHQVIKKEENGNILVVIDIDDLSDNRKEKTVWESDVIRFMTQLDFTDNYGENWSFAF